MSCLTTSERKAAEDFCAFLDASPSPYHAVDSAKKLLTAAGFTQLRERDPWTSSTVRAGGKYFVTRNNSSIVAFALGGSWRPGSPLAIVGAHTDSPCLKVKPTSAKTSENFLQLGVETYGGGIWHTWFDRDLSLAGRVLVRRKGSPMVDQLLVHVKKPILRVPTLAIHLDRTANDAFKFNNETHLTPILGTIAAAALQSQPQPPSQTLPKKIGAPLLPADERHHRGLISLISSELGLGDGDEICDFELCLYDTQGACVGGLHDEFVFSGRLDNLGCTFASMRGLVQSLADGGLGDDGSGRVVACFDHEEIGSVSAQGADSNFLPQILTRLNSRTLVAPGNSDTIHGPDHALHAQAIAKSFLVSADMAHALNPNYAAHYEDNHRPALNGGIVIKVNSNQRYATNAVGVATMQAVARTGDHEVQVFVVRQDHPCGSTIGPMLSASMGVRTCDVGIAQLDMHSCREMCGAQDIGKAINFFATFFNHYNTLWKTIEVD
ncbi:hypothetical protein PYCC9005_002656 [Savitreella phatthalungensis]